MVRLALVLVAVALLAACKSGSAAPPATTAAQPATTVAATTTTLAWDSAEAIQRVATYCGVAAGDLSPVTSTPDGASYAPSALNGVAVATVDAEGHISCQGFGNR
jgi:hypothetical protein